MAQKKILLIDDSEIDNFINKAVLSKSDFISEIFVRSSGKEALEFLKELVDIPDSFPDFIFLDIRMPIMDGFQFMEEYSKLPLEVKNRCKVYILSSSIDPLDIERAKNCVDVENHLTKPLAHHSINVLINNA
ncbi:response regulator [Maribacter sp. CXY002]|uniref:response regulator n=1 Tax=Maribacter luteocoastalis TaxID=3407671 RepID=UPI003B672447